MRIYCGSEYYDLFAIAFYRQYLWGWKMYGIGWKTKWVLGFSIVEAK